MENKVLMNWGNELIPEDHVVDFFLMQNEAPVMALNNFMNVISPLRIEWLCG
jgi:hypothetical protein